MAGRRAHLSPNEGLFREEIERSRKSHATMKDKYNDINSKKCYPPAILCDKREREWKSIGSLVGINYFQQT